MSGVIHKQTNVGWIACASCGQRVTGDIYFVKPVVEESLGEEFEKVLQDNLWNLYEE